MSDKTFLERFALVCSPKVAWTIHVAQPSGQLVEFDVTDARALLTLLRQERSRRVAAEDEARRELEKRVTLSQTFQRAQSRRGLAAAAPTKRPR